MKTSYKLITNTTEVYEQFKDSDWVGFDIETTALDPFDGKIRLIQISDGTVTHVVDMWNCGDVQPLCRLLESPTPRKIAHNAKFDAKWVKYHLGVEVNGLFCTYITSRLLSGGDQEGDSTHPQGGHRLVDVAQRYLGVTLDKSMQVSDWSADKLDLEQVEYAVKDAVILPDLKDKLWDRLVEMDLLRVAEIENECIVPVITMELNGFYLDSTAWLAQLAQVEAVHEQVTEKLKADLGKTFPQQNLLGIYDINLDSPQQVQDALTWAGVPDVDSTQEWKLKPLVKDHPVVGTLIEYRGLAKAVSSYGADYLDNIKPSTGRIHAEFDPIRAKTGRFGCSKPNLQQIPAESEYRWCFRAAPGNKLTIADYSQIELRILADRSEDEKFIAAFTSGADLHTATAAQVFNVPIDEVTADQRSFAKRLNFGLVYGISAGKFAALTGTSKAEAEIVMKKYFGTFTGIDRYIRDSGRQGIVDREVRTASGRLMKLRFDDQHRGDVGGAKRLAVNMPIQGTSADILKRALRLLHDSMKGTSMKLVNIVHDEIVVEHAESEKLFAPDIVRQCMVTAGEEFISKVPVVVDVKVEEMWKK